MAGRAARIKHLVLELEIAPSDPQESAASLYALESSAFRCLGCRPPRSVRLDARLEIFGGILIICSDVVVLTWRWVPYLPVPPAQKVLFGAASLPFFYLLILEPIMDLRQRQNEAETESGSTTSRRSAASQVEQGNT